MNNNMMMQPNSNNNNKSDVIKEIVKKIKDTGNNIVESIKGNLENRKVLKQAAEQEKAIKQSTQVNNNKNTNTTPFASNKNNNFSPQPLSGQTITNSTISKPTSVKKKKPELSEQEKRMRKKKIKKIFRTIMTIPEIILVVLLILFLKGKYETYSQDVHQVLMVTTTPYIFEIHRDNDNIFVIKKENNKCKGQDDCQENKLDEYYIRFNDKNLKELLLYFDISYKFKSENKKISIDKVKTDVGLKCIRSMIFNDAMFLDGKRYKDYKITDFEQNGEYHSKGYKIVEEDGKTNLIISIGEKEVSGYSIALTEIHKLNDEVLFYIKEKAPKDRKSQAEGVSTPFIKVELSKKPEKIRMYNVDTTERYRDLDGNDEDVLESSNNNTTGNDIINNIPGEIENNPIDNAINKIEDQING